MNELQQIKRKEILLREIRTSLSRPDCRELKKKTEDLTWSH